MKRGLFLIILTWSVVLVAGLLMTRYMITIWPSLEAADRTSVVLTGIGAAGTLLLAAATVTSVIQNQVWVKGLVRDRKKPLAKDALQYVIQPSINAVERNLEQLNSETGVEWGFVEDPKTTSGRLLSAIPTNDPVALHWVAEESPNLWSLMRDHDSKVAELAKFTQEVEVQLENPILNFASDPEVQQRDVVEDKLSVILNAILMDLDHFGEPSPLYQFWETYGDELKRLMREEDREELDALTEEYHEHCEELRNKLMKQRIEIQNDYGLSVDNIPVDEDPVWRDI